MKDTGSFEVGAELISKMWDKCVTLICMNKIGYPLPEKMSGRKKKKKITAKKKKKNENMQEKYLHPLAGSLKTHRVFLWADLGSGQKEGGGRREKRKFKKDLLHCGKKKKNKKKNNSKNVQNRNKERGEHEKDKPASRDHLSQFFSA